MKKIAILLTAIFCFVLNSQAQSYTQHVQQQQQGRGTVTIHQSKEIDSLVNGIKKNQATQNERVQADKTVKKVKPVPQNQTAEALKEKKSTKEANKETASHIESADNKMTATAKEKETHRTETRKVGDDDDEMNIPTIDMRKKVMRHARKVTGYRVQAFAGGNTRNDKLRAQQIGEAIKMRYPNQPIYVHFYSPRWICRIGNFRNYSEAASMLKDIKAMGYKSATIVKGKITVFE